MLTFKDLGIGDTFDFISGDGSDSFYLRCVKVSARCYRCVDPSRDAELGLMQVGTIKCRVYHVFRKED